MHPAQPHAVVTTERARESLRDILSGRDTRRLAVIVGPCSIHDRGAALEYAGRLAPLARRYENELVLVMRTYFEKPRSEIGWKGLINDPDLDGRCDIERGLGLAREILVSIGGLGLPCASEMLEPLVAPYLADLLSWAVIGARTSESQPHRSLASGLPLPVGMKNGTDGDLEIALAAMRSAREAHSYVGIDANGRASAVRAPGNPACHLVLRGGGRPGAPQTNFDAESVARAASAARRPDLLRPVVVDCSHGNSGKDPTRQGAVCREVLEQFRTGQSGLAGIMLESHLRPGRQALGATETLAYGVSITDACIGWQETEALLGEIAESVSMGAGGTSAPAL